MLFEIFDDGKFLGFEDAPHEEAAIVVFANKRHPRADPFKTLAEVRQDQGFPHREATAVAAYATMPPAEAATEVELSEYSKVFELLALADEAAATAARLRDAATRTSGLEREANTRQAAEAEAEATRIEAELQQPPEFSGLVPTQAKPDQGQAAPAELQGSRQRQRHDDLALELERILASLRKQGKSTAPHAVMDALKERAGRPDSCIAASVPEGVAWTRGTGKVETLNVRALARRLKNLERRESR